MNTNKLKPTITISSCLGFEATRYNGAMLDSAFVRKLRELEAVNFVTICPEVGIGLGIPRETLRLVMIDNEKHLIQPKTNQDVTKAMTDFTDNFVKNLHPDGFILKADSPSVGTDNVKVYQSKEAFVGKRGGGGLFTDLIMTKFPNYPIQSDRRLKNPFIQDSFLTKVYTLCCFRSKHIEEICDLLDFHQKNYYLLLSHDQKLTKQIEKLIKQKISIDEMKKKYFQMLLLILKDGANREEFIYVFDLLKKELKKELKTKEIELMDKRICQFKTNSITKTTLLTLMEAFAISTENQKLLSQTIFNPYPLELVNWDDPLMERFIHSAYEKE